MVNQRRYKRGKRTHRRKTGRVRRSRVKRSRVKRTKIRGGGMGETGHEITTFHEPNKLHNFSMESLIQEGERVRPAVAVSNSEIKYLQKRKKKKNKNKKNKLIGKESNKI